MKQKRVDLLLQLTRREIESRYRGSALGILWSVVTPLFMLVVFTFVFSTIFQAKWTTAGGNSTDLGTAAFATNLFAGLVVFNLFSDVVTRAGMTIVNQPNLVKKVVFPLELLPVASLLVAILQASIAFAILLVAQFAMGSGPNWTAVLAPIVILPACLISVGLGWFLAALGVYIRDIQHIVPPLVTALLFLTPVFYPPSALPSELQWLASINPLSYAINDLRAVTISGTFPEPFHCLVGLLLGFGVAVSGYVFFMKTRKGFADVL